LKHFSNDKTTIHFNLCYKVLSKIFFNQLFSLHSVFRLHLVYSISISNKIDHVSLFTSICFLINKSSKFIAVYEIFFTQIKYFKNCLKFCQSHPSRRFSSLEKNRPDCLQCQGKSDPNQPCWRSDRSDAEKIDSHLKHQRVNLIYLYQKLIFGFVF